MGLDYRNSVAVGEIAFYSILLSPAVFLCFRHGFGRSDGWLFLVIFALARIIGPAMQLATISDPTNKGLYEGWLILSSIGITPLMLSTLGMLRRVLENISQWRSVFWKAYYFWALEGLLVIGLILGIVGGVKASSSVTSTTGTANALDSVESKAADILFIVGYLVIVIMTLTTIPLLKHADSGERVLFLGIMISLPILAVRLVYGVLSVFTGERKWSPIEGNVTYYLCLALIEEVLIDIIYQVIGLFFLEKRTKSSGPDRDAEMEAQKSDQRGQSGEAWETAKKIGRNTIIGRIVMAVSGRNG